MGYTYDKYAWAELTANTVHAFYSDVTDYLADQYESEWMVGFWEDGAIMPVMIHMMALHLLTEARRTEINRCLTLPELLRTLSVEEFAEAFWHEWRLDPVMSNRAQKLLHDNDTGDPLYGVVRIAAAIHDAYGEGWIDLPDDAFASVWEWYKDEDMSGRNKITWEA
jgi:hypothetical protein